MVGAFLDKQAKSARAEPGAAEDRRKFANVIDHTAVPIGTAGLCRTGGEEDTLGPIPDIATLANHLPIRCPKRRAFQQKTANQARPYRSRVKRNQCAERRA